MKGLEDLRWACVLNGSHGRQVPEWTGGQFFVRISREVMKQRSFKNLFGSEKPVIGCIHLLPLPGSPLYGGSMESIYRKALEEVSILVKGGVHALIVENFRDKPFFPGPASPGNSRFIGCCRKRASSKKQISLSESTLCAMMRSRRLQSPQQLELILSGSMST